jgi:di/tricarboxylate transporter
MNISTETVGRLLASGRNYASTLVGFIGGIGLMSASQQKGFSDAIGEIFNGLSQVVHGATSLWQIAVVAFPIIGVIMAKFASNSAKVANQAPAVLAAVKDPNTPISPETKTAIVSAATEVVKS